MTTVRNKAAGTAITQAKGQAQQLAGRQVVVALCNITDHMVAPWLDAGYSAVLVDPQHDGHQVEPHPGGGYVLKLAATVEGAMPVLAWLLANCTVVFVAGFPPCTDMAVSGARWFAAKRAKDPMFQAKAVAVAEQCRVFGQLSGAPYFVENPASVLSRVFGKSNHTFHPADYSAYEPDDHYTKRTCLWTGNGFVMPAPLRIYSRRWSEPDNRIHFASPGPERANIRSATPKGFARAIFAANAPHLLRVTA